MDVNDLTKIIDSLGGVCAAVAWPAMIIVAVVVLRNQIPSMAKSFIGNIQGGTRPQSSTAQAVAQAPSEVKRSTQFVKLCRLLGLLERTFSAWVGPVDPDRVKNLIPAFDQVVVLTNDLQLGQVALEEAHRLQHMLASREPDPAVYESQIVQIFNIINRIDPGTGSGSDNPEIINVGQGDYEHIKSETQKLHATNL